MLAQGVKNNLLGSSEGCICGEAMTIADHYAVPFFAVGELIGSDYAVCPDVQHWLARMTSLPSWQQVNAAIEGYGASLKRKSMGCV